MSLFKIGETVKIIKYSNGKKQAIGVLLEIKKTTALIEIQKHRKTHPFAVTVPLSKVRKCKTRKRETEDALSVDKETIQ